MMNEEEMLGSLEERKRRILDIIKGPGSVINSSSRSWVEVVMKMKESPKEWVDLSSLAWINQVILKLKKERIEKEEREKKEKEEEEERKKRQWDALPSTALLNIFCKFELKDRLQSIPLVCKSWKYVTDDPHCWSSMIPDSISPEDAFIKNTSGYKFESYEQINKLLSWDESMNLKKSHTSKLVKRRDYNLLIGISRLFKEEGDDHEVEEEEFEEEEIDDLLVGLKRLQTLIKKSGGGAAITTLYLSPFLHPSSLFITTDATYDEILHLIANCCPNLKHISFNTVCKASTKALLQVINNCKKLELVDLSYSVYCDAPLVIQEMGKCLPNLHGFRIKTCCDQVYAIIATYLPQLKLLSIDSNKLLGEHLSNILFCCRELRYLYVIGHYWGLSQDIIDQCCTQIPEFFYDIPRFFCEESVCSWSWDNDSVDMQESTEEILNWDNTDYEDQYSEETHHFHIDDDFCINHYRHILKQRKEDQYVSILKEKRKYHYILKKTERDKCSSRFKKKKKKYQYDSSVRKKKKIDQCDYADYVIR